MASPLRPQFFISRQNGTLTALIAVDELPPSLNIQGVPRVLSHSDTHGMTSLGTVSTRGQYYIVDGFPLGPVHANNAVCLRESLNGVGASSSVGRVGGEEDYRQLALSTLLHATSPVWNPNSQGRDGPSWRNAGRNTRDVVKYVGEFLR
jgi:hypothetical protein